MTGLLHPWRDTLQDLGVVGLIPPPYQPPAAPDIPPIQAAPVPAGKASPVPTPAVKAAPVPPRPAPAAPPLGAGPSPEAVQAAPDLAALEACTGGCLACPLGSNRMKFVFGEGSPRARLMFVGEGPGRDEDLQGRPFVGRAGELLDKMIVAMGFRREDVYICNVVKCRPPDNRTPTPAEAQRCLPYLRRQIELVRPQVIVTLGATPLRELVGVQAGITRIRGQWQRLDMLGGIPVMPTFHPAYVLRQYTQEVRAAVWGDLKAVRTWLDEHPGGAD